MALYFCTAKKASTKEDALTGRSSYFFFHEENAKKVCDEQNARAESLGIKARYVVSTADRSDVPNSENPR